MEMLDLLISLGFPYELFFPTEPPIEREKKLLEEKKLETRQQRREYEKSLSKEERKAMEDACRACSAYNSIQMTEPEMLTLEDFVSKLKSRWEKGQESVQVQVARLNEFEALDSRWRKAQRQQNGDEEVNESDDESYGSGSSYEYPGDD